MIKPSTKKTSLINLIEYYKSLFHEHITTCCVTLFLFIGGLIGTCSSNWYSFETGRAICAVAFAFGFCAFAVVFIRPFIEIVIYPFFDMIGNGIKIMFKHMLSTKIKEETIIKIATAGMLIGALLDVPYAYYQFMKIGVCVLLLYLAYLLRQSNKILLALLSLLGAILFNPISKFAIHKAEWQQIDLVLGILLIIWSLFDFRKNVG